MSERELPGEARSGYLPVAAEVESRPLAKLLADAADWPRESQEILGRLLAESESSRRALRQLDDDRRLYGLPASPESFVHAVNLERLVRFALGPGWDAAAVLAEDDLAERALERAASEVFATPRIEDVVPLEELLEALDVTQPGEHEERRRALRECAQRRFGAEGR